jgi:conjugative relaxase-like TrwC/TraI family protein
MLRVTTIHASSAGDSARYYTRYLAEDSPDGEGRWIGRQADGLGLSGAVSTEDLEALLSGHDPVTGRALGTPLHDRVDARGRLIRAVGGFDATFSAPKSVSILWALTGDEGWADAHDVAVRAVLHHLERYGSTTRIRTSAGRQFPDSRGLIMAAFPQATSREDDPQLHSHVVISTKVQTDRGWYALDARYLKRKQRALGGLYQSVLRAELSHRYGISWGPIENGQAEIVGVADDLLAAFSKRTAQVNAALADKVTDFRSREGRDPTRWERAALTREAAEDTRAAKTGTDAGNLAVRWRDEAAAVGWTGERLLEAVAAAARTREPEQPPTVSDVMDKVSAAASTWMRADVLQGVSDLAPAPTTLAGADWARTLERAADQVLSQCTSLDPKHTAPRTRDSDRRSIWIAPIEPGHTSEAVLAQEERILAFALDAHLEPEQPSAAVDAAGLDVLQVAAARAVAGHDRLVLVVGPAGAGKTAMLRAAAADLAAQQRPVFSVAPTAKAANVLRRETGADADTIAKLLFEWARDSGPTHGYRLPPGTTLICDEAGMTGTATLDRLVHLAQSQRWRLVLVGDHHQLHAVGRGGMFNELCRTSRATNSPPSTASTTRGSATPPSRSAPVASRRSTPTSTTTARTPGRSGSWPTTPPPGGSTSTTQASESGWSPRPTSTSTPSTKPSRSSAGSSATSATTRHRSRRASTRPSATSSSPGATTAPSGLRVASPSATGTAGPSTPSAATGA